MLRLLGYVIKQNTALAGARGMTVIGLNHVLIQKIPPGWSWQRFYFISSINVFHRGP